MRTLHARGLPPDATDREVRNMLRFFPGFLACSKCMAPKNARFAESRERATSLSCFLLFNSNETAVQAMDALNGADFDTASSLYGGETEGAIMEIALAKTNLDLSKIDKRLSKTSWSALNCKISSHFVYPAWPPAQGHRVTRVRACAVGRR